MKVKAPANRHLKTNVILGFGMAVLAVILTGYITYVSFNKLLTSVNALSEPNPKLIRLNSALKDLSKAESNLRIYTLTDHAEELKLYHKNISSVKANIDTLCLLTKDDSTQHAAVEEILALINEKVENLNSLTEVRKRLISKDLSAEAMRKIAKLKKKAEENKTVLSSTKITEIKTENKAPVLVQEEVIEEENGLLDKLKRIVSKPARRTKVQEEWQPVAPEITTETTVVIDTIALSKPDSVIIGRVKKIIKDLQGQELRNQQLLSRKEAELVEKSLAIKDRIIALLNELEKKEEELSQRKRTEAKLLAESSTIILTGVLVLCLLSSLIFGLFIFSDINKSNYYRKQLVKAKQKSEELAKVKQEFLANMSHEIRTPLGAILGFAEQLSRQPLTEEQHYYVNAVKSSSEYLLSTVNEILDLSKIEAGKLKVESIPFSFEEALISTCNTFGIKAAEKGIGLVYHMDPVMPQTLKGDPFRLKQVLYNLVSNAVKFTESGGVEIHAKVNRLNEQTARIQVEVKDSGIGIAPEKLHSIFDDFSQADSSTTRRYGGSGLGLAICKKLLELQGGDIQVQSQPGEGTTFTFNIDYAVEKTQWTQPMPVKAAEIRLPATLKVLVIDDDRYNIALCEAILKGWGLMPDLVQEGRIAMQKLASQDYDVVLTDIHMPEISGLDIIRFIRSLEGERAETPVIAFTANVIKQDLESYLEAGVDTCLTKPFKALDLYNRLVEVLPYLARPGHEKEIILCSNEALLEGAVPVAMAAPYSLEDIKNFAHDDEATIRAFVEKFIHEASLSLAQLQQLQAQQQWLEVGNLAHKMIPSFSYFQIHSVIPALKKLEQLLHHPPGIDNAEADALVVQVLEQSALVLELLAEEQVEQPAS